MTHDNAHVLDAQLTALVDDRETYDEISPMQVLRLAEAIGPNKLYTWMEYGEQWMEVRFADGSALSILVTAASNTVH